MTRMTRISTDLIRENLCHPCRLWLGRLTLVVALVLTISACQAGGQMATAPSAAAPEEPLPKNAARVVHVFVALCDNEHQGIVPVPARIGNGEDPDNNLYWGAAEAYDKYQRCGRRSAMALFATGW